MNKIRIQKSLHVRNLSGFNMQQLNIGFLLVTGLLWLLVEGQKPPKAELKCGRNQHYDVCGTACPTNCYNLLAKPKFCTEQCVSGCFCDPGYIFKCGNSGECVPESKCLGICPENSHYEVCGSVCDQRSCDKLSLMMPVACKARCFPGCFCNKGYVYEYGTSGRCVPPCQCPSYGNQG